MPNALDMLSLPINSYYIYCTWSLKILKWNYNRWYLYSLLSAKSLMAFIPCYIGGTQKTVSQQNYNVPMVWMRVIILKGNTVLEFYIDFDSFHFNQWFLSFTSLNANKHSILWLKNLIISSKTQLNNITFSPFTLSNEFWIKKFRSPSSEPWHQLLHCRCRFWDKSGEPEKKEH